MSETTCVYNTVFMSLVKSRHDVTFNLYIPLWQDGHSVPRGATAFPLVAHRAPLPALQPANALLSLSGQTHRPAAKEQHGVSSCLRFQPFCGTNDLI